MNKFKQSVCLLTLGLMCLAAVPVRAYFLPIDSVYENIWPDLELLIESEITRWKQEGLKYKEVVYTDTLGTIGEGNDGKPGLQVVPGVDEAEENQILSEVRGNAGEGAGIITETMAEADKAYSELVEDENKKYIEANKKKDEYTETDVESIYEYQADSLNDIAVHGIAMAAMETANAGANAAQSDPELRAKEIAMATDLGGMFELMLGMDRRIYERSLEVSAIDAANATLNAMRVLQGLSQGAVGEGQ